MVGVDRGVAVSAALSSGELPAVPRLSLAFTSQRCNACGHMAAGSRESQALFRCVACGYACNADVNAAENIAAGHTVTARGGDGVTRPVNREPQRLVS
ncbi:MAG TPA: zinc ribbon domain-containing protein [Streptosporangiaceae bacterium]|nr:zinc ribbon domain-containing protein [Streptosporangiaceae bacterium]